jgi:hypothetical protein
MEPLVGNERSRKHQSVRLVMCGRRWTKDRKVDAVMNDRHLALRGALADEFILLRVRYAHHAVADMFEYVRFKARVSGGSIVRNENPSNAPLAPTREHDRKGLPRGEKNVGALCVRPIERSLDVVRCAEIHEVNSVVVSDWVLEARGETHPSAGRGNVASVVESRHLRSAVWSRRIEGMIAMDDEVEWGCRGETIHVLNSAAIG